jgi:ribosome-associated protein
MAKKEPAKKKAAPKKTAVKKVSTKPKAERPKTKKVADVTTYSSMALAKAVAQGMFELKAEDIKILDMRKIDKASADFFVICHAKSDKQVEAIGDSVEEEVFKIFKEWPWHREGYENLEWVLLDYIDVVAHIFQQEKREFYAVEELWGDAVDIPFEGK